jgi:integration host factor subunit alpha
MKKISRANTHKKNIVKNIFNSIGIPSSYVEKLVNDLIDILISTVYTKGNLKIKNFGEFNLKNKKKRIGRNPKNKINYEIVQRNILTFKAADKLTQRVNSHVKK